MEEKKKKNITLGIMVVIILILVVGIWYIRQGEEKSNTEQQVALETPLEITSLNIEELKIKNMPIILDFGSDSCVPCVEMAPVLEKVNLDYQGKAIIHFIDVWKYPNLAQDLPIQVIPTQLFINADGTPYQPNEEVLNTIPGFQIYVTEDTNEYVYTTHQGGLTEEQMVKILAEMGV